MSAQQFRELAACMQAGPSETACREAAALLRSLADAIEKGPEPVLWVGAEALSRPRDYEDPCCNAYRYQARKGEVPLYDPTAILAAEMRGEGHIGRLREELAAAYVKLSGKERHASDCATSRAPAADPGPCDCDAVETER